MSAVVRCVCGRDAYTAAPHVVEASVAERHRQTCPTCLQWTDRVARQEQFTTWIQAWLIERCRTSGRVGVQRGELAEACRAAGYPRDGEALARALAALARDGVVIQYGGMTVLAPAHMPEPTIPREDVDPRQLQLWGAP